MGIQYSFFCPCGYSAEVSGQSDAGMAVVTQTIVCLKCKRLYDVPTWLMEGNIRPPLECPKNKAHPVEKWDAGDPCPRCGDALVSEGGPVAIWD